MPLPGFDDLLRDADVRAEGRPVAVAGAADLSVLMATRAAVDRGWIAPLLAGSSRDIHAIADGAGISLDGMELLDVAEGDIAPAAVATVRSGRASMLMKGRVSSPTLMEAIFDPEHGLRGERVVCQIVLMEIVPHARTFLLADTGVIVRPKVGTKADILREAVALAIALGEPCPRVALMAASEVIGPAMPETLHAAELQRRNESGEFPDCRIQGPLSFDLAYAAYAADQKRVAGPVVGAADIMIFPDLASANLTVKAIMYTADCRFGGVLGGTTAPVVFMSRADSPETRLRSLALAMASDLRR